MIRLRFVPSAAVAVAGAAASKAQNVLSVFSIKGIATSSPPTSSGTDDEEAAETRDIFKVTRDEERGVFRVLDIGKPKSFSAERTKRAPRQYGRAIYREKEMVPTQDWESVWPTIRTFHPAVVPLPIRQGFISNKRKQVHPGKYGNVELMKIPNFLHLTPPVVKKHADLLRRFCTPWPKGNLEKEFPLTQVTSNYLNASSSIRDHRARVVSLVASLKSLKLNEHARDKMIRLLRERYNPVDDSVTIVADTCPYRPQNADYAEYLLTALYHESLKKEKWEVKSEVDLEAFDWSFRAASVGSATHRKSVQDILNAGESGSSLETYRQSSMRMFGLTPL